jgi:hypothetical protein
VQEQQAVNQRRKSVYDLLLVEGRRHVRPPPVLELGLEGRQTARVEQAVVVDDGTDEGGVGELGKQGDVGGGLEIFVGLL